MKSAISQPTKTVEVPGKIMLAGEYAVLNGHSALAVTLSKSMKISLSSCSAPGIICESDLWDRPLHIEPNVNVPESALMLEKLAHQTSRLFDLRGARLQVSSELNIKHGIGSSSALRIGVLAAAHAFSKNLQDEIEEKRRWQIAQTAYEMQRQEQGKASGYDVATQITGGLVRFHPGHDSEAWPRYCTSYDASYLTKLTESLQVFVGGSGAPTEQTMRSTDQWLRDQKLHDPLAEISERLIGFILSFCQHETEINQVCGAVGQLRRLLQSGPNFPIDISKALGRVANLDKSWSYKTSGAGGEDAILIWGFKDETSMACQVMKDLGWTALNASFVNQKLQLLLGSDQP